MTPWSRTGSARLWAGSLLAAMVVGPSVRRIARLLRVPYRSVEPLSRRWRAARIWRQRQFLAPWADPDCEGGDILLTLYALVGAGQVEVTGGEDPSKWRFALADSGEGTE